MREDEGHAAEQFGFRGLSEDKVPTPVLVLVLALEGPATLPAIGRRHATGRRAAPTAGRRFGGAHLPLFSRTWTSTSVCL